MKSIPLVSRHATKILILDNIRSAQNVGSLFRTADAGGIDLIYVVGITPTPLDQFGRKNPGIAKTALGAEDTIPWKYMKSGARLYTSLKKQNVQMIAIEQSERAVDYKKVKIIASVAFILGNEVDGLSKKTLDAVDIIAEIPMRGGKESLNVSVAGGIALFRILKL